jgi:hypothetical protein
VSPPARVAATLTYDPRRRSFFLFGGGFGDADFRKDLWEGVVAGERIVWTQRPAGEGPGATRRPAAAYDARAGRLLVSAPGVLDMPSFFSFHMRGDACVAGSECASGQCVDGHCCDAVGDACSACGAALACVDERCAGSSCGTCETCGGAEAPGLCTSVRARSPEGQDDPDTCGGAHTCDTGGDCKIKRGGFCERADECLTGHCVDGVCCRTSCSGQCEACNLPGTEGTCAAREGSPVGERPPCSVLADSACGRASCDGNVRASCARLPREDSACGVSRCEQGSFVPEPRCDGHGACVPSPPSSCSQYVCTVAGCLSSCATDDECIKGAHCERRERDGDAVSKGRGICVGLARCDEATNVAVAPDGTRTSCGLGRCAGEGTCLTRCLSVRDCIEGAVCSEAGSCFAPSRISSSAGCIAVGPSRTPGEDGSVIFGFVAFAAVAIALRVRRTPVV